MKLLASGHIFHRDGNENAGVKQLMMNYALGHTTVLALGRIICA